MYVPMYLEVCEGHDHLWLSDQGDIHILNFFFSQINFLCDQIAACRALNGLGLALAFPAIQSLVADSTETHNRGFAFGVLQAVGNVGGIMGGFCAIMLAGVPNILGVSGWRFAFHLVGTISVVIGLLLYFFAVDPHFVNRQPESRLVIFLHVSQLDIHAKVDTPNLVSFLNQTPIFEWYMVRCGTKNGYIKDMYSKEIGLIAHNMIAILLSSVVNTIGEPI